MGMLIGAGLAVVLFAIFGLLPAFRFGSYMVLIVLNKATGRPVKPTLSAQAFIIAGAVLCIVGGFFLFVMAGALLGSII